MDEQCKKCKFWKSYLRTADRGQCRVNPPTVVPPHGAITQPVTEWPTTLHSDWCGKFEVGLARAT